MKNKVFLDTAFAIALSSPNDYFHRQAILLADQLQTDGAHMVTTRAVMLEIGNALSKQRYRHAAVRLLNALEIDPNIEIIPLSEPLYEQAFQLYRKRPDKEWGLTDCISFVIMQDQGITRALTTDEHFQQAGFQTLLRKGVR